MTGGTGTLGRELVRRFAGARTRRSRRLARARRRARRSRGSSVRTSGAIAGDLRARRDARRSRIASCAALRGERHRHRSLRGGHDVQSPARGRARHERRRHARRARASRTNARRLERIACFSTVYVAGRTTGCFAEHDIGGADGFVNSYEQSKAEMEVVVRDAMRELPIAIYRLSTIIGDSRTGDVTGFNAIHHALRLLYQGLAPMVPGQESSLVDLIPRGLRGGRASITCSSMRSRRARRTTCARARRSPRR